MSETVPGVVTGAAPIAYEALYAELRRASRCKMTWVMDLASYRQMRAMAVTEQQETERAYLHATAMIPVSATLPLRCPACAAGPFFTMDELMAHMAAMADPVNREPADGDQLLGLRIVVRDGGGEPHIEWLTPEEIGQ